MGGAREGWGGGGGGGRGGGGEGGRGGEGERGGRERVVRDDWWLRKRQFRFDYMLVFYLPQDL